MDTISATGRRVIEELDLTHHGVVGMKWGKRKAGTGTPSSHKAPSSPDHDEARSLMTKKKHELSTHELNKLNKRLQAEKTNSDLRNEGALNKIKKGTAVAGTILAVGTTINAAIQFANSPAGQAVKKSLQGALKTGAKAAG